MPSTPIDEEELAQELSSCLRTVSDLPQWSGTQHSSDSDDDDKQGDRAIDLIPDTVTKEQYEALEQIFWPSHPTPTHAAQGTSTYAQNLAFEQTLLPDTSTPLSDLLAAYEHTQAAIARMPTEQFVAQQESRGLKGFVPYSFTRTDPPAPPMNISSATMQSHTTLTSVSQLVGIQPSGSSSGGGGGGSGGGGGHTPMPLGTPEGGGGPPVGGVQGAMWGLQQIPIATASTHMMGKAPGTFKGDRTKAKQFFEEFETYQWLNCGHQAVANPCNWILMFCTFLKGPKINTWCRQRVKDVGTMIASGHNPNDKNMWTAFKDRFLEDFKDTSEKEDALTKFMGSQMKGDDLDTYTTSFNDSKELASFKDDALGMIIAYRHGLKQPLHNVILDHQWPWPDTLLEWQDAARRHNAAWVEKHVFGALHGSGTLGRLAEAISGQSKTKTNTSQCTSQSNRTTQAHTQQEHDPDAMDVDVVQTGHMSNEERQKLIKEGRCFYCKDVGHLSQECPKKPKPRTNASPAQSWTIATVENSKNAPVTAQNQGLGVTNLAEALKNLSEEDRGWLLDEIVSGQSSF